MDKIRKGDQVVIIAGKDKGKRATVLLRIDSEKIVVDKLTEVCDRRQRQKKT